MVLSFWWIIQSRLFCCLQLRNMSEKFWQYWMLSLEDRQPEKRSISAWQGLRNFLLLLLLLGLWFRIGWRSSQHTSHSMMSHCRANTESQALHYGATNSTKHTSAGWWCLSWCLSWLFCWHGLGGCCSWAWWWCWWWWSASAGTTSWWTSSWTSSAHYLT